MTNRELRYSELLLFTGAGASKTCGLPDMREFAELFRKQVRSLDKGKLTVNLLDDILWTEDEPATDLEGLMTALTSLSGEVSDPAVEVLMDNGQLAERDLIRSLTRLSSDLAEWTTKVPFISGSYGVIPSGGFFADPSTAIISDRIGGTAPIISAGTALTLPSAVLSSKEIEEQREHLSDALDAAEEWQGYFSGLKAAASDLLERLKAHIQNTYSVYKARLASRSYRPLLNELTRRYGYLDVFTLNYDTVLERVLTSMGRSYFTGFKMSGNPEWRNSFSDQLPERSIRLYKLHGSVNWFEVRKRAVELPVGITAITTPAGPARNMMVYPLTQKIAYDEPHLTLFSHFSRAIRKTTLCLIIGCSLRDELVSSTLAFAARDRPDLRFIFCGSEDCIRTNYWLKRFRRRFTVMDRQFGDDGFLTELKSVLDSV